MKIDEEVSAQDPAMNLTPLIDVVFLLLIFFMAATTFLNPEREIDVELPTAESAGLLEHPPEEIVINVEEDGTVIVSGTPIRHGALVDLLRAAAQRNPGTPVTIRGDRLAHHGAIVGVMDACGSAGLFNLAVGTTLEERGG